MTEETGTIQVRRTKILQQDIHMYTSLSSQDNGRRRKKDAANKSGNPNTQPSFLSGNEKRIAILGLVEKRKKKTVTQTISNSRLCSQEIIKSLPLNNQETRNNNCINVTKDELPSDNSSICRKAFSKNAKLVPEHSWHNISFTTRMQIPLTIKHNFTVTTLHM